MNEDKFDCFGVWIESMLNDGRWWRVLIKLTTITNLPDKAGDLFNRLYTGKKLF